MSRPLCQKDTFFAARFLVIPFTKGHENPNFTSWVKTAFYQLSFRYSHQSTRKLVRDSRSAQGSSRGSRGYRSQPSPSSTEETAEETTETDSQNERNPDYSQFTHPYM